jgi:hypothetical protein
MESYFVPVCAPCLYLQVGWLMLFCDEYGCTAMREIRCDDCSTMSMGTIYKGRESYVVNTVSVETVVV